MRKSLEVVGARTHNLRNLHIEIPRDKLVVFTGVSGSGKSSLAFDTIYAEGQRRYMESLSSFARRFVDQVRKPDVDFMFGLSPVVSIEQKTVGRNPRSTVGTLTDIASYINLLFATIGTAHCPFCQREVPMRSRGQIAEQLLSLPTGTTVELRAPIAKVYDEDWEFVFSEVRKAGYRRLVVNGRTVDIGSLQEDPDEWTGPVEVIVDKFVIRADIEKQLKVSIGNALCLGDQFISVTADDNSLMEGFGCPEHRLVMGDVSSEHFMFNDPRSACRTCLGLGTYRHVHPTLLVPDPSRSIAGGAFVKEALRYNIDTWDGKFLYSLAKAYGFSLDTPYRELPEDVIQVLLYGTGPRKITLLQPPGSRSDTKYVGQEHRFEGYVHRIERSYRRYRQQQEAHSNMEAWLEKVMVERPCPDCHGARLRSRRLLVTVAGKNVYEFGELNFGELAEFLDKQVKVEGRHRKAGAQVLKEIRTRVDLLLGIGLDYLNFNRPSGTLSGGESQRIRLSTQIGSGLMGMLYVLDEPSIGLHPKDNVKMIETLRRLRDLGNTVIVVEHDEDTIRAADHLVELGPGAGVHGGEIVAQGSAEKVLANPDSLTGAYLSGRKQIPTPKIRRPFPEARITIEGARQNNLKDVAVEIPLGRLVCITGASGSGKSTLINDILYKALYARFYDSRTLAGDHNAMRGAENIADVVTIDQSPIGRNPRSNPATYVGFYDLVRDVFANVEESVNRGYSPGRFSFNVKGGRCEECSGDGVVTTHLGFMPDVETVCDSCKGARFNQDTLEITHNGKTIADVLDMPIEEGVEFFASHPGIGRKVRVLNELGLGYLTLGQSATTLSGGEAQRIKLASELAKLKKHGRTLYIFDEPTTGLHFADIERLIECINRLVDAGNTAVVIEHHADVIKQADWVIDLGPEGGHKGGEIVFSGTPEDLVLCPASYTGRFLSPHLS
ncbi:MAG TPA: excinuclease ABC subunit UvrA [Fimbriimonas sp.]|nr:excinuclease ABC subunit UvrA [Fimbriimonas sp.]